MTNQLKTESDSPFETGDVIYSGVSRFFVPM